MNKVWRTKADVLDDLGEVNGRRTGAEHLDQHVVAGERPPPIHHETPDAEELSYFGGAGPAAAGAGPDLDGISVMLKMVNAMDETVDNEPFTFYRNKVTDEIRISKLNPCAGEYIPGARYNTKNVTNRNSPKKHISRGRSDRTVSSNNSQESYSTDAVPNLLPKYNMFRSRSEKVSDKVSVSDKETPVLSNKTSNANGISEQARQKNLQVLGSIDAVSNLLPKCMFKSRNEKVVEKGNVIDKETPVLSNKTSNANGISEQARQKNLQVSGSIDAVSNLLPKCMFKSRNEKVVEKGNVSDQETLVLSNKTSNANEISQQACQKNLKVSGSIDAVSNLLPKYNMFESRSENATEKGSVSDKKTPVLSNKTSNANEISQQACQKNLKVSGSIDAVSNLLPKYNMFKSRSENATEKGSVSDKKTPVLSNKTSNANQISEQVKSDASQEPVNSVSNPNTESKKAKDIKEIQEKIKSTIAGSENSLQSKRQKNVAIATLLKMGMIPTVEPVKLIKPEYFENPLPKEDIEESDKIKKSDEEVPSKSSSEEDVNYVDQDSISKVNGWFNNMECPKPKTLPQEPLTLKENPSSITFKKKTNSVTSRKSDTSKVTPKESPKAREVKSFKPSPYANDLLKKYEDNAQRAAPFIDDLGTRLERQLKERDEVIRQKLARQNAG